MRSGRVHRWSVPLLAVALAAAGCGGGDSGDASGGDSGGDTAGAGPTPAATSPAQATTAAPRALTPQDVVEQLDDLAAQINVRSSDLPGFEITEDDDEDESSDLDFSDEDAQLVADCVGLSGEDARRFVEGDDDPEIESPSFERGEFPSTIVSSSVGVALTIVPGSEGFERFFAVYSTEEGIGCLADLYSNVFATAFAEASEEDLEFRLGDPVATLIPVPTQGRQRSAGFRVQIPGEVVNPETGEVLPVPFNVDLLYGLVFQGIIGADLSAVAVGESLQGQQITALLTTLSTRLADAVDGL